MWNSQEILIKIAAVSEGLKVEADNKNYFTNSSQVKQWDFLYKFGHLPATVLRLYKHDFI